MDKLAASLGVVARGAAGPAPAGEVGSVDEGFYKAPTLRNAPGYAHGSTHLEARARLLARARGIAFSLEHKALQDLS